MKYEVIQLKYRLYAFVQLNIYILSISAHFEFGQRISRTCYKGLMRFLIEKNLAISE